MMRPTPWRVGDERLHVSGPEPPGTLETGAIARLRIVADPSRRGDESVSLTFSLPSGFERVAQHVDDVLHRLASIAGAQRIGAEQRSDQRRVRQIREHRAVAGEQQALAAS